MSKKEERIGEESINNQGLKMWICDYRKYNDIDIQFEDGYISKGKEYKAFKKGKIHNPNYHKNNFKNRVGEENINYQGLQMKIIEYRGTFDIDVKFEDGYISKNKTYNHFKNGSIKNLNHPEVYGVGYISEGKYSPTDKNNKTTKEYKHWVHMIQRCYSKDFKKQNLSYENCFVCKEWHNFQNFAEWFHNNYYEIEGETMCLDKDILVKGNRIYSPETCVFVPRKINSLFVKRQNDRGESYIGVYFDKNTNKFISQCSNGINKSRHLGCFNTELEAFNTYKNFKENYIKKVADEYKDKIPEKLYNAMYNYIVEIDD